MLNKYPILAVDFDGTLVIDDRHPSVDVWDKHFWLQFYQEVIGRWSK